MLKDLKNGICGNIIINIFYIKLKMEKYFTHE